MLKTSKSLSKKTLQETLFNDQKLKIKLHYGENSNNIEKYALKKTKILITWLKILKICLDGASILPNALVKVILFTAYIYVVCEIRLTFV